MSIKIDRRVDPEIMEKFEVIDWQDDHVEPIKDVVEANQTKNTYTAEYTDEYGETVRYGHYGDIKLVYTGE